jgi:hypothetical protein
MYPGHGSPGWALGSRGESRATLALVTYLAPQSGVWCYLSRRVSLSVLGHRWVLVRYEPKPNGWRCWPVWTIGASGSWLPSAEFGDAEASA